MMVEPNRATRCLMPVSEDLDPVSAETISMVLESMSRASIVEAFGHVDSVEFVGVHEGASISDSTGKIMYSAERLREHGLVLAEYRPV